MLLEQQLLFFSGAADASVPGVVGVVEGWDDVPLVAPPPPQQLPVAAPPAALVPLAIGTCLLRSPLAWWPIIGEASG